jgi:hypothetical protein
MRPIYEDLAPTAFENSVFLGTVPSGEPDPDEDADALERTARFEDVQRLRYRWSRSYSAATWVDELPTHSIHRGLSATVLEELSARTAAAIDSIGGRLEVPYETSLLKARRVPDTLV